MTSDVSIGETASAASFFLSNGLIVTGSTTGASAEPQDMLEVQDFRTGLPVLIGSGITPKNMHFFRNAEGFIVGSYLKANGDWRSELDPERIEAILEATKKYILKFSI